MPEVNMKGSVLSTKSNDERTITDFNTVKSQKMRFQCNENTVHPIPKYHILQKKNFLL
jgi:hypothetical protein